MPDQLFDDLYRNTENLAWAPVEQVRRSGRQRSRRTRVAASLAGVVTVVAVAAGAVALGADPDAAPPVVPATGSPTPTPNRTPTPSTSPSHSADPTPDDSGSPTGGTPSSPANDDGPNAPSRDTSIPAAAMMQLADLPKGFTMTNGEPDGDWTLESVFANCRNQPASLARGQVAERFRVFDSPTDSLIQRVTRYSGEAAAAHLDAMREQVEECDPHRSGDSLTVLAAGFGGDESMLVGSVMEGRPARWILVRQGDLVAQLRVDKDTTPQEATQLVRPVADRLCAGTDAC
ncbi:hypothetical protein [Micromonospora musae]|uniref:Uncharacterized protein n=1 Tax=Micromonospora musae TaxID=1894970 RepID=A0A3A9XXV8_9ACTN|nr:hypothetical protein [Micromonospora musae]RKN29622.1 hypothetical protein D7044_22580 [Micromonospora musae]